jgi:hypothetical protein
MILRLLAWVEGPGSHTATSSGVAFYLFLGVTMEFLLALHPIYKCTFASIIAMMVIKLFSKSLAYGFLSWSRAAYERYNLIMGIVLVVLFGIILIGAGKFILQLFGF